MFRSKDFLLMEVLSVNGKNIGFINDIIVDFGKGIVEGFSICCSSFLNKNVFVLKEDIISFNEKMIIKKTSKGSYLRLLELKNIEILDVQGRNMGIMEDIIFDNYSFEIYGLMISKGLVNNFLKGKNIILMNDLILGDDNILYYGDENKIKFKTMPHKVIGAKNEEY